MFTDIDPADNKAKNNKFFISKVEVDIVYGSVRELSCTANDDVFNVKTSMVYL